MAVVIGLGLNYCIGLSCNVVLCYFCDLLVFKHVGNGTMSDKRNRSGKHVILRVSLLHVSLNGLSSYLSW